MFNCSKNKFDKKKMKGIFFASLIQTGKYIGAGLAVIGCAGAGAGKLNILIYNLIMNKRRNEENI
jgi:F0F1-type ATP synthase membrane subunit c/vacuolar-type H+-ATPase subunit K